jgi:phage-related baseplate assembly protein
MTAITLAPRFSTIDLSGMAPPDVIETLDYEAIVTAMRDDLVAKFPAIVGVIDLESEPARKLIEVFAYRELGLRARVNDAARAVMLAYALESDLDHIGARYAVERLEGESDARFRHRIAIAPEALSVAGPEGAYQFHALSADVTIADVSVYMDRPGRVIVTVMMEGNDPVPSAEMLLKVREVINSKVVRPLTDEVAVLSPQIIRTPIAVKLTLYPGPSAATVKLQAETGLANLVERIHFLGYDLKRSAIYAASHEGGGVHGVEIITPAADIVTTPRQLVIIESVTVTTLGRDV